MTTTPTLVLQRNEIHLIDDFVFKFVLKDYENAKYIIETVFDIKVETLEEIKAYYTREQWDQETVVYDMLFLVNDYYHFRFEIVKEENEHIVDIVVNTFLILFSDCLYEMDLDTRVNVSFGWFMDIDWHKTGFGTSLGFRDDCGKQVLKNSNVNIVQLTGLERLTQREVSKLSELEALSLYVKYGHEDKYQNFFKKLMENRKGIAHIEETLQTLAQNPKLYKVCKKESDEYHLPEMRKKTVDYFIRNNE